MAYVVQEAITVTTDASGVATDFTTGYFTGFLLAIVYTIDGTNPYPNNVVVTVTTETSAQTLWAQTLSTNASAVLMPRGPTHSTAGVAALYAAGGTAALDRIALGAERIKVVLSAGGNTKLGNFRFLVGG